MFYQPYCKEKTCIKMAKKITVRSAKGTIRLEKSDKYVGIKTKDAEFSKKEKSIEKTSRVHLGGFEIMEVKKKGEEALDKQLDKLRKKDAVDVGSHIYHIEGQKKTYYPYWRNLHCIP